MDIQNDHLPDLSNAAELARQAADPKGPPIETLTSLAFSPGGIVEQAGLQVRPQQRTLACEVARSADGGGYVFANAPTGSGKSLAYGLPGLLATLRARAAWRAKNEWEAKMGPPRLVISTANITLQSQIVGKDIPLLAERVLRFPVQSTVLKGRGNYACRLQLQEHDAQEALGVVRNGEQAERIRQIVSWTLQPGCTGDKDDLPFDPGYTWSQVSRDSNNCIGKSCPFHPTKAQGSAFTCFAEMARSGFSDSLVAVMNHSYLVVAPPVNAALLCVDEAHSLEQAIRSSTRADVSTFAIERLATALERLPTQPLTTSQIRKALVNPAMDMLRYAEGLYRGPDNTLALGFGWAGEDRMEDFGGVVKMVAAILTARAQLQDDSVPAAELERMAKRLRNTYTSLALVARGSDDENASVVWTSRENRQDGPIVKLHATIVDAGAGWTAIQKTYPSGVLTSATLAVAGQFGPARMGLGVAPQLPAGAEGAPRTELDLPSPLPLETAGLLVVPRGPLPKDKGWQDWAVGQAVEAVRQAQGRTLVLCSSWKSALAICDAVRSQTPYPTKRQGDAGRQELWSWFRDCISGVLVATRSFFEGLDVPGESLSCVVIDRIPFAPPGDPVEEAVGRLYTRLAGGGSGFILRSLPQACTAIEQAAGRLIRSVTDRGAVVLLDGRATEFTPMGAAVRRSLPPFQMSHDLAHVGPWLAGQTPPDLVPPAEWRAAGAGAVRSFRPKPPPGPVQTLDDDPSWL